MYMPKALSKKVGHSFRFLHEANITFKVFFSLLSLYIAMYYFFNRLQGFEIINAINIQVVYCFDKTTLLKLN